MNRYRRGRNAAGPSRRLRGVLLRSASSLLFAAIATAVHADVAVSTADKSDPQPSAEQNPTIIVTGERLFRDVRPERSLDSEAITSYGVSTIDELIAELESEIGSDEELVFVVNGERIFDLDDIGAYPVEIIRQLQVLPRGTAPRVGGSPTQRVFNLALHNRLRTGIATIAPRFATEGDWQAVRGEGILTTVDGRRRGNVALRVRDEDALLESQRGIIQPAAQVPFAPGGNVIAYPDLTGEIDPLLSDAGGQVVTVAPIPSIATPTLGDFAAAANDPNVANLGDFRTLRPATRNHELNATYTAPLTAWLTSTTTLRLGKSRSRSLIGLASGLFVLDDANPFSPFSVPVALAVAGDDPLRSRYGREFGDGSLTLNARLGGSWQAVFNGKHSEARETTRSERGNSPVAVALDDSTNPFASGAGELIEISTRQARSRYRTSIAQAVLTGSPLRLPAGGTNVTLEARLGRQSIKSDSSFSNQESDFHRSERGARVVLEAPLASRRNGFLPQLGELKASAEYDAVHFSDAGSAHRSVLGLTWEPVAPLRLRAAVETAKDAPHIELLGSPTIITPSVRIFDPLTGETVDVTYVSGGNPALAAQKTETRRVSAILRLVPSIGLQLNAEYTDVQNRNFVSSLPPASAALMLAFPERFVRNGDGELTLVDVRPVNFASHHQQRLRWGFNLNKALGSGSKPSIAPAGDGDEPTDEVPATAAASRKPPTRLQLTANHSVVFKDEISIREGLEKLDLLDGGAVGIAGGRLRHQLDATAALTSGGTGVRLGATWLGASKLQTRVDGADERLRFSPLLTLNLRAFADARRFLPNSRWAKGTRVSLNLINLTNDRQTVRDSFGETPLQYQRGYRDPLGRTVEFELRKAF